MVRGIEVAAVSDKEHAAAAFWKLAAYCCDHPVDVLGFVFLTFVVWRVLR